MTVYFYLDREPTDFDYESVNTIMDDISDRMPVYPEKGKEIEEYIDECIYDSSPINRLDRLDGFVYLRREHDMEDNPS